MQLYPEPPRVAGLTRLWVVTIRAQTFERRLQMSTPHPLCQVEVSSPPLLPCLNRALKIRCVRRGILSRDVVQGPKPVAAGFSQPLQYERYRGSTHANNRLVIL